MEWAWHCPNDPVQEAVNGINACVKALGNFYADSDAYLELDKNKKLTRAGLVPVRALEIYKNAAEHIRLNDLCIGLTPDCKMITIAAREDVYSRKLQTAESYRCASGPSG